MLFRHKQTAPRDVVEVEAPPSRLPLEATEERNVHNLTANGARDQAKNGAQDEPFHSVDPPVTFPQKSGKVRLGLTGKTAATSNVRILIGRRKSSVVSR